MNPPISVTLIVRGGTILTMAQAPQIIEDGAIAIRNDTIVALGGSQDILSAYQAEQEIDAHDCLIIPGLINAHSHIPMTYFRGLADDLPLDKWLQDYIWPMEARLLTPEFVYHAALHGAAEMLANGITLTKDMYFHGGEIAKALTETGLRGMIGEAVVDFNLAAKGGISAIGRHALEMRNAFADNPLVDFTLSPHSIYACAQEVLEQCAFIAREHDFLVQLHLSETAREVADCLSQHQLKPVDYLRQLGLLDNRLIIAHGIWVDEAEMQLLAQHHTAVAICTESNLKLAAGIAPLKNYFKHNICCCLATDGVASNNNLDLFGEMDMTAKLHKAINADPTFLPAYQVLKMTTLEAARALHRDAELGSLEIGKKADLVVLDTASVNAQPYYDPYSLVVYSLTSQAVRDVIINGKTVYRNRIHQTVDTAELIARAKAYRIQIKEAIQL